MKLLRFIKGMVTLTAFALIYIHLQMQIFDLAYQGKIKEKVILKLIDDNGNVTYNILKLKSSNNLGEKLLGEQSQLKFLDNNQVVKLDVPQTVQDNTLASAPPERKSSFLENLLTLKSQAVAKPLE